MGKIRDVFSGKKDDEWLEWLSDEPPAEDVQAEVQAKKSAQSTTPPVVVHPASPITDDERRERLRRAGNYTRPAATPAKPQKAAKAGAAVSINISLPKVNLPKVKLPPKKQLHHWSIAAGAGLTVMIATWGVIALVRHGGSGGKHDVQGTSTVRKEPSFKPLAPQKKPELGSVSSPQAQYDGKRNLYTYTDNFTGANLTVSQQPMPEPLKKDPAKVLQLTDSIHTTDKVTTAYGVAYFGIDEKSGVLRGVLINTNKDLLVFFLSDKKLDGETIKFYLESLR